MNEKYLQVNLEEVRAGLNLASVTIDAVGVENVHPALRKVRAKLAGASLILAFEVPKLDLAIAPDPTSVGAESPIGPIESRIRVKK